MLSRSGERVFSEEELSKLANKLMLKEKNVFVLCSSTNIDRIAAFCSAVPDDRPIFCDSYQRDILKAVETYCRYNRKTYSLKNTVHCLPNDQTLADASDGPGFLMFVRANESFKKRMEPYRGNCRIFYSMWSGYLEGETQDPDIVDFLHGYDIYRLHTSGHATGAALREVYDTVRPRRGVIPIHGEAPERFKELLPGANVLLPRDGEELTL